MKKISLFGFTLVLMLFVFACSGGAEAPKAEKKAQPETKAVEKEPAEKLVGKAMPPAILEKSDVGISDDEIVIGQWGALTGPAALWGAVARGTKAYFEMINAEGGIHGRKLKLLIRDDSYQPPKTKAAVMELVEKIGVFAFVGGLGTGTGMAVMDYLADKKIPWIGPGSGSSKWTETTNRYRFAIYPTYQAEAKGLVRYLSEKGGVERIAFFYQNDDFGKESLMAAKAELKKQGKTLAAEVSVEMSDTDLSSHVLKLKQSKPDAVILWLMPKHAAITMKTAAKLNFKPKWASTSSLSDAPLMHHITGGLWDGVIFTSIMELPDSEKPVVKKYRESYDKYGLVENPNEKWGIFFMAGYMFAEPFVEALRIAGRDLDREKLVDALHKLNNWNEGITHNVTYTPTDHQGQKSVFISKCENGKAIALTEWMEIK